METCEVAAQGGQGMKGDWKQQSQWHLTNKLCRQVDAAEDERVEEGVMDAEHYGALGESIRFQGKRRWVESHPPF